MTIAEMGGEGDGLAPGPIFAPFTLPGERVRVAGTGERRKTLAILEPSPERVEPPCPHFGLCGGCALQHWRTDAYLAWKRERLIGTLARQHIETEVLPIFASPPFSRRRVALHARQGAKGEARLGYKIRNSWDLVDIQVCPIADPKITAALPAMRRLAAPLFEHPKSAPTLHVTATDDGIDIDITGVERKSGGLSADARMRLAEQAAAGGFARVSMDGEIAYMDQAAPSVRLGEVRVVLPPGAFLQAVPPPSGPWSSSSPRPRRAPSGSPISIAALAPSPSPWRRSPRSTLLTDRRPGRPAGRRPLLIQEMKKIDLAVFDPPRAGAAEQVVEIAGSKVSRVIGVSCNPATFARDARTLIDAGFRLEQVFPVDQFLWSPHVELIGVFSR